MGDTTKLTTEAVVLVTWLRDGRPAAQSIEVVKVDGPLGALFGAEAEAAMPRRLGFDPLIQQVLYVEGSDGDAWRLFLRREAPHA